MLLERARRITLVCVLTFVLGVLPAAAAVAATPAPGDLAPAWLAVVWDWLSPSQERRVAPLRPRLDPVAPGGEEVPAGPLDDGDTAAVLRVTGEDGVQMDPDG